MPEIELDPSAFEDDEEEEEARQKGSKEVTKPKEAKESKRGHYRKVECPFCHSMVGNLGNHVKLKHPAEAQQTPVTKETLLGQQKPPPASKPPGVLLRRVQGEATQGGESLLALWGKAQLGGDRMITAMFTLGMGLGFVLGMLFITAIRSKE